MTQRALCIFYLTRFLPVFGQSSTYAAGLVSDGGRMIGGLWGIFPHFCQIVLIDFMEIDTTTISEDSGAIDIECAYIKERACISTDPINQLQKKKYCKVEGEATIATWSGRNIPVPALLLINDSSYFRVVSTCL